MLARLMAEIRHRRVLNVVTPYLIGAWLIIQIAVAVGPALSLPSWVASFVVITAIVGFPVVLYFAWFFDWTGEGFKRTPGLIEGAAAKPIRAFHWIGLGVTVLFAVAAGYVSIGVITAGADRREQEMLAAAPTDKSVAVLPFDDLSPSQDLGYLAQGLAEEITVALGKIGNMRVSAPNSAFKAAELGSTANEIGKRLGVAAILQGSVRIAGDQLRVTASLISASDGLTIWTDAFSRSTEQLVLVEEQIARSILAIMLDRFLNDEDEALLGRPPASDAHDLYLRGRQAMRLRTTESLKQARAFFEQSIAADGEYAPGYAGLAAVMLLLADGTENYGTLDTKIATELAKTNVEKALLRDPGLAEAHAVDGRIASMRGDKDKAIAAFDRAIEINPSYADAYLWRSNLLSNEMRYAEANASLDQAFRLDPLSPVVLFNKGFHKALEGKLSDARGYYNAILDLEPDSPLGFRGLADAARREGDLGESARIWKKAVERSPESTQYRDNLVGALITLGLPDVAAPFASAYDKVNLMLARGETEEALGALRFDYAASPDDPWMAFEAGWYELLYGEEERAFDALIKADKGLEEAERFAMPYCSPAIEAAYAFARRGDNGQAKIRIDGCAERLAAERAGGAASTELDYLGARIFALKGAGAKAAAELKRAYDGGWREPWTARDPLLQAAREAPAYADVISRIENDLSRQRETLLSDAAQWAASGQSGDQ